MSFLNKLKKQNIETEKDETETETETEEKEKEETESLEETNKKKTKKKVSTPQKKKKKIIEVKDKKQELIDAKEKEIQTNKEKWFKQEGELAVDVYQTEQDIVIRSAIAGIKSENIDISLENEEVIIKGDRKEPEEENIKNYFHKECYWGRFHKRIILPEEVDNSRAEANMEQGILFIRIPKIQKKKKRKIKIR